LGEVLAIELACLGDWGDLDFAPDPRSAAGIQLLHQLSSAFHRIEDVLNYRNGEISITGRQPLPQATSGGQHASVFGDVPQHRHVVMPRQFRQRRIDSKTQGSSLTQDTFNFEVGNPGAISNGPDEINRMWGYQSSI
jgi:hypothetical protein